MSLALSLLYAFLMLLVPLAEALYHGRSPGALLYLYWVESFALLILHSARIVLHQAWTNATGHYVKPLRDDRAPGAKRAAKKVETLASRFTFLSQFIGTIAIFTLAHGLFILLLVFVFKVSGPVSANDLRAATIWGLGVPLGLFIVDLFTLRRWPFSRLRDSIGPLALRMLVTQFGIIFGMIATAMTKSPWALFATFFAFRVLSDGLADWSKRTQRSRNLSPRFAAMIAKKEAKSIERVYEEFRNSAEIDREIDAALNAPRT